MVNASSTATGQDEPALAGEFPPATEERWLELVGKALGRGGVALSADEAMARLRSTTADGIAIEPLYTTAEVRPRPVGPVGGWEVRQLVEPPLSSIRVLEELEKGAAGVILDVRAFDLGIDALDMLLTDVLLDLASVSLRAGIGWQPAGEALIGLWQRRGIAPKAARGSIGADPFGGALAAGDSATLDDQLGALVEMAAALLALDTGVQLVTVDGGVHHLAGGTDAEELGGVLATAVAYPAGACRRRRPARRRVRADRARSRGHRRPVRHDRQVPRGPPAVGPGRRGRSASRPPPRRRRSTPSRRRR